jgi:DNA-binding CsgD family transcriptional regulator
VEPVAANAAALTGVAPGGVALSIEERLDRLPPEATAVAEVLAVLGDGCSPRWAAELTGLRPEVVAAASDGLRSVAVLAESADLAFVHPILATSVYHAIPPGRRATLHARAAATAHRHHAPAEVVAAQLLRTPDAAGAWALNVLRAAAAAAVGRGVPSAAATDLRRALDEVADTTERARLLVELGSVEALARHPDAASRLAEAVATAGDPDDQVVAALALWSTNSFDGRVADGLALLRDTLARSRGARPDLRARLELELARATRSLRTAADEGRDRIADFVRRRDALNPTVSRVGLGLAAYDAMLANEPATEVLTMVERALPLDDAILWQSESQLLHLPLYTLMFCDELDRVRDVLRQFEAASVRRGVAIGPVIADFWGTFASVRAGDLADAEVRGARALAGAIEQGWLFGKAASQLFLGEIALERGEVRTACNLDRSVQALISADPDVDDKGWADHMLHGSALCSVASGDVPAAFAAFLEVGRRHDAWRARCPSELPWRSNAALCAALLGQQDRAEALATEEVELAQDFGARRALGIALRAHGVTTGSEASLREAVAVLVCSPARLEHARALRDLGAILRLEGRDQDARTALHEAVSSADELGAVVVARRARSELRAAGGRPRLNPRGARRVISSSENRTAHLAARGLSNPEIARTLYISRKTVEAHLYNVYRKLGINSRADLAGALAGAGPGVGPAVRPA